MRAAVLGSPIEHSRSPELHRAAYRALGLAWEYDALEVPRGGLADFVKGLDGSWRGLSITMPLKEEALALADVADDIARLTGAANTLVRTGNGGWAASNTDVFGMVQAVHSGHPQWTFPRALVLGSGATARSAVVALGQLGTEEVVIAARRSTDALVALATECGMRGRGAGIEPQAHPVDLLVSTLPADVSAPWASVAPVCGDALLLDVTYAPWPTTLAAAWMGPVVGGAAVLLWQAVEQVHLMTGRPAPVDAMRTAGYPQA